MCGIIFVWLSNFRTARFLSLQFLFISKGRAHSIFISTLSKIELKSHWLRRLLNVEDGILVFGIFWKTLFFHKGIITIEDSFLRALQRLYTILDCLHSFASSEITSDRVYECRLACSRAAETRIHWAIASYKNRSLVFGSIRCNLIYTLTHTHTHTRTHTIDAWTFARAQIHTHAWVGLRDIMSTLTHTVKGLLSVNRSDNDNK